MEIRPVAMASSTARSGRPLIETAIAVTTKWTCDTAAVLSGCNRDAPLLSQRSADTVDQICDVEWLSNEVACAR